MLTRDDSPQRVPWMLLIHPALLTLWSTTFALWFLVDGVGAFEAFGIPTRAEPFILLSSAGRYLGIAVAMWLGLWILRTRTSMLTALLARLAMDVVDAYAGMQTGLLEASLAGWMQPLLMFIGPSLITIVWLARSTGPSPGDPSS